MQTEVFTLTQQGSSQYANEEVLFMPEEAVSVEGEEKKSEDTEEGSAEKSSAEKQEKITPEIIHEHVQEVLNSLKGRVEDALKEIGKEDLADSADGFRKGLDYLSLEEVEKFLREIRDVHRLAGKVSPQLQQEIHSQEARVQEALAENVTRRRIEESPVLGKSVTLGSQVIEQFAHFLVGENVTIEVGSDKPEIAIRETNDGQKIVSLPEPTLENLLAVAKQLHYSEFSTSTLDSLEEFAKELRLAAALLDENMFPPEAIMSLYNLGVQLEQTLDPTAELQVMEKFKNLKELYPQAHEHEEKIFFNLLLGRHDYTTGREIDRRTLYDVYFKRWQRQNPEYKERSVAQAQEAFDGYLRSEYIENPQKTKKLLQFLQPFIEKSLSSQGKAQGLVVEHAGQQVQPEILQGLLDPWRVLVGENGFAQVVERLGERVKPEILRAEMNAGGVIDTLREFNAEFQPDKVVPPEFLDYLPSRLVEKLAKEDRDPVACIIAIAYEKAVLEKALTNEDGTSDYLVMTELAGTHATLLIVDINNNSVYRLDPSAPKSYDKAVEALSADDHLVNAIYDAVSQQFPEDVLEDFLYEPNPKDFQISLETKDTKGNTHTVISGDRLITSTLLNNMAALGDNEYFHAKNSDELRQMQLAAIQDAIRLAPENPIARKIQERLVRGESVSDLVNTSGIYEKKVPTADGAVRSVDLKEYLIGDVWPKKPALGWPADMPDEIKPLLENAEVIIGNKDTRDVDSEYLTNLYKELNEARNKAAKNNMLTQPLLEFISKRMNALSDGVEQNNKSPGSRGEMSVFNLRRDEIKLFASDPASDKDIDDMEKIIEGNLKFFALAIKPGYQLPSSEITIANGRFEDIVKILNVNKDPRVEKVRELAAIYALMVVNPALIAAAIESGDTKQRVEAGNRANSMDSSGGHDVYAALQGLHEGRVGFLADRMWSVMNQWRLENTRYTYDKDKDGKLNVSVPIIPPAQYEQLREGIIKEQIKEVENGSGRYVGIKREIYNNLKQEYIVSWMKDHANIPPSQPQVDAYMNAPKQQEKISKELQDELKMDTNLGQLVFIMDKRASAIGILGTDPDNFDPGNARFIDGQDLDVQRYEMYTDAKKKMYLAMRESRVEVYIRLRYGDEVANKIKKNEGGFNRFVKQMGWDIMAPGVEGRWENGFVFGRTDLYDLKKWREEKFHDKLDASEKSVEDEVENEKKYNKIGPIRKSIDDGTQFGLFIRLLVANKSIRTPTTNTQDDYDPVTAYVRGKYINEDLYKALKAIKTNESITYEQRTIKYGLMVDTIAPFFPDELMKPFAYEPDYWTDETGGELDPRFVEFFGKKNSTTAFLDSIPGARREAAKKVREIFNERIKKGNVDRDTLRAQIRFQIFQTHIAPTLASIRSLNMRGVNPDLSPEERLEIEKGIRPRETPKQTNFGMVKYNDFGVNAENVKKMMAAMTIAVVSTKVAYDHDFGLSKHGWQDKNSLIGRLAFDPLMERVLFKSPLSIEDAPYWMMHGKDIYHEKHPSDLVTLSGFGRYLTTSALSSEIRDGMVDIIRTGNPAQIEETILKPFAERIVKNIRDMKSMDYARENELAVVGMLLKMMVPETAELFGAESLPLWKNSEMRKIFGKTMRAMNEEQLKTIFQSQYSQNLKPEYRALMHELLFGKKFKRRSRYLWKLLFAIFVMTTTQAFTTTGEVFQGELKGV